MRLFRKVKPVKEELADFSKYKIKVNGKAMCTYEALTGRPFLKIETEDDIKHLFYASLVSNNEEFSTLEYEVFELMLNDRDVLDWMSDEYVKIGRYLQQFKTDIGVDEDEKETGEEKDDDDRVFYMLDAISGLIVKMGIDPRYVMYDMEEWEITYYYRIMRDMDRERLTEGRLWTYLQVLPHVGKKLDNPEKMLPFPWEKNNKKRDKELEKNTPAVIAFLRGQDGKGIHTGTGQEGLPEGDGTSSCSG